MTSFSQGQLVKLKPNRAKAYGLDPSAVYYVERTFQKPGYVAVWAILKGGEMAAPFNRVKTSELRLV